MKITKGIVALALIVTFSACAQERKGTLERAGERGDEIVDNVREGKPMLHRKGPLEKAGEAIDETFDSD